MPTHLLIIVILGGNIFYPSASSTWHLGGPVWSESVSRVIAVYLKGFPHWLVGYMLHLLLYPPLSYILYDHLIHVGSTCHGNCCKDFFNFSPGQDCKKNKNATKNVMKCRKIATMSRKNQGEAILVAFQFSCPQKTIVGWVKIDQIVGICERL